MLIPVFAEKEPMEHPFIELRNLSKTYQEGNRTYTVLQNIHERITPGEFVILLGRSGSGKSTLLNLISGIDLPSSGEVIIDGLHLTILSEHERTLFRRQHIGFIFQLFNLIPTLTVAENLFLPLELNHRNTRAERRRVLEILEEVGLGDRLESYPDQLSGGEQQRVAIVRALAHDPQLLLADEPTANLDLETGRQVIDLLYRLTRQTGKTMVMATHDSEVVSLADRLFTIRDGRLVAPSLEMKP